MTRSHTQAWLPEGAGAGAGVEVGAGLEVEAGSGAGASPCFLVEPEKCKGMCSAVEDHAIVDEITWIARLLEIKIKSQTQTAR